MEQDKKIVVDTNLSIVDFVSTVNDLVVEYFDEDGTYQPHIGMLNAMRIFYNKCVKESKFDIEHNIVDALELEPLVADDEFMRAFNDALCADDDYRLNFATAMGEAVAIVEHKRTSVNGLIDRIKMAVLNMADKMNGVLTKENIEKISEVAKELFGDSSAGVDEVKGVLDSVKVV